MDDTTQKLIQGLQSRVAALENDSGGIESYEMFSTNVSWPVDIAVSGANYVVTTGETPPFGTLDNTSFTVGTADTLPTHVGFLLRDHEASTSTAVWIFGGDSTDCSVFVPSPVLLEPAAKYWPIVPVARRSGGVLGGATTTYARLQRVYARFALAMANAPTMANTPSDKSATPHTMRSRPSISRASVMVAVIRHHLP